MTTTRLVLIKGAGDLATGCAVRLHRAGFAVVMTERPDPRAVRRTVAFSEVVFLGTMRVEDVEARLARGATEARRTCRRGAVAVVVDPEGACRRALGPAAIVDARMAKKNLGTAHSDAPIVIGLGPGFTAGRDVHAVVETNRGHRLGAVLYRGAAEPNTGIPGAIDGHTTDRLLHAPASGVLRTTRDIGDRVEAGELIANVGECEVRSAIAGVVRGLLRDGSVVTAGAKIGDVDPRADASHCLTVSDKALAVAGGALEAILYLSKRTKPRRGFLKLPSTTRERRRPSTAKRRRARS